MTSLDRRTFLSGLAAVGAALQLAACGDAASEGDARAQALNGAGYPAPPPPTPPSTPPLQVAMLLYPGCTALDLVAPQLTFATLRNVVVHLVWKDLAPVLCDSGLSILPTATLAECPAELDVLFVGGSARATWPLMVDDEVVDFVRTRGERARFVTSVCTGAFLLGAAGLLRGYRATSYWPTRHLLSELGATPSDERVVVDRNRITGGGITAGIDFGLRLSEILRGRDFAELQQLLIEYAPEPPFEGAPETARPEVVAQVRTMYGPSTALAASFSAQAAKRFR